MKLNRIVWGVLVLSMLGVLAPAAFAQSLADGDPKNGLSSQAFRRNALTTNKDALLLLLNNALNDDLPQKYLSKQLNDPRAMAMMEEIVECALDSNTKITFTDKLTAKKSVWQGAMGFCQRWHTSPLRESEECQELITACIMARVNGLGQSIPLSFRGQQLRSQPLPGQPLPGQFLPLYPLRNAIRPVEQFRESAAGEDPSEGLSISSLSKTSCPRGGDCNWTSAYVGKCVGEKITLSIRDPACGSTSLRVCAGIHGCLGPGNGPPNAVPYSRHILDKKGACNKSPLTFECPTGVPIGGYFSVLVRPDPGSMTNPTVLKLNVEGTRRVEGSSKYPATEEEVFSFREGAFYGNLFKPEELTWNCLMNGTNRECSPINKNDVDIQNNKGCFRYRSGGIPYLVEESERCLKAYLALPYRNVYACYSLEQQKKSQSGDLHGVAYLNSRICNVSDPNQTCFFHKPSRCFYSGRTTGQPQGAHCKKDEPGGYFQDCQGPGNNRKTYRAITTFLNEPCDLIGNTELCARMSHF